MAEAIDIKRKIYGKNTFTNVVDVSFKQLVPQDGNPAEDENQNINVTIVSFFDNYDTLFYDIPPSGSDNSHLELVRRSADYIGVSLEDLQEEIRNLREENVSLKNQIFSITNPNG
jgi:hypothetical protein